MITTDPNLVNWRIVVDFLLFNTVYVAKDGKEIVFNFTCLSILNVEIYINYCQQKYLFLIFQLCTIYLIYIAYFSQKLIQYYVLLCTIEFIDSISFKVSRFQINTVSELNNLNT